MTSPSEAAVLEAAVHDNLARLTARLPDDPREALRALADVVWAFMTADRDLIRLMIREFTGFPELFERMWQGVVATVYHRGTEWITTLRDQGRAAVTDPEATAAFLAAWLDSSVAALRLT
ncbi:TetR/AcrR family transcriptional regulator C-terminal domain-containing protein [Amycolatopsis sp. lyj-346]|uniref:TetR/AcrR family transcriptional regulator C-terminal domain-containing protein n=1 Tax=Amycolatopsis sp. lyj-346 TaxID=2789289 RepID=UPI003979612B